GEPSNLERIGRWLAAYHMVHSRPILGVGYGAYGMSYFQYRVLTLKTGQQWNLMGVHNEYFKVVAEIGIVGAVAMIGFLVALLRVGNRAVRHARDLEAKTLALAALAAVVSYLVHGFFNSYTGIDKVSVPFWFCVAAVAVLEARTRPQPPPATPVA